MNPRYEQVNQVLADWNPIGVPDEIALDEYRSYIPVIIKTIDSDRDLLKCLQDILVDQLEVGFDSENASHLKDLKKVCDKISQIL